MGIQRLKQWCEFSLNEFAGSLKPTPSSPLEKKGFGREHEECSSEVGACSKWLNHSQEWDYLEDLSVVNNLLRRRWILANGVTKGSSMVSLLWKLVCNHLLSMLLS